MKLLITLLGLSSLMLITAMVNQPQNNEAKNYLYRISINDTPFCSAFKVSDNAVLTAKHCCENISNSTGFVFNSESGSGVEEVIFHPETTYDACIIKTTNNLAGDSLVSGDKVYDGEQLYSIGHPKAENKKLTIPVTVLNGYFISGPIYFMNIAIPVEFLIETDKVLIGGMSGGPLINGRGEVVGINARANSVKQTSYFVPISRIKEWVNETIQK